MKTNYLLAAILCCLTPLLHAQTALSGKVVSADTNEPLAGVNIRVDNSLTGCTTNGKGEFIIDNLPDGQHTLRFSYIASPQKIHRGRTRRKHPCKAGGELQQPQPGGSDRNRYAPPHDRQPRSRIRNHSQRNRQRQRI